MNEKDNNDELILSSTGLVEFFRFFCSSSEVQTPKFNSVEKIPIRATLFSALFTLPYAIGMLNPAAGLEEYIARGPRHKIYLTIILCLRSPLTALITYASNKNTPA